MEKSRDIHLDTLRVTAMSMVVILHVAAQGFYNFSSFWSVALIYNAFSRVAVPVMFILSGYFLIPKIDPVSSWLLRLFKRVIFPYICWSIIYQLYEYAKGITGISYINIFFQPSYFHLGFMFQYMTYQISLPLLQGFWNNSYTPPLMKKYVIALALIYGCLAEFVEPLLGYRFLGFQLSCIPYYIGMCLLGAYLHENIKQTKCFLYLWIYVSCSVLTAVLTFWKSYHSGVPTEIFLVYASPLTIIGAASLFCFVTSISIPKIIETRVKKIAKISFSVYLMHPLLLDILKQNPFHITWVTYNPVIWIPVYSLLIIESSIWITIITKKINFFTKSSRC